MSIFKYRPLALGCLGFLAGLLFSFFLNDIFKIVVLIFSVLPLLVLIIIYLSKRKKCVLKAIIFIAPISALLCLSMVLSLLTFSKDKEAISYCTNEELSFEGTVKEVRYFREYMGIYVADVSKIGGEACDFSVIVTTSKSDLSFGDTFVGTAVFKKIENTSLSDEVGFARNEGIFISARCKEHTITGNEANEALLFFKEINLFLQKLFVDGLNAETSSLFVALFLGDKSLLPSSISRDFSRLGISHILALSGMHLSMLVFIFTFVFDKLGVPKWIKTPILILILFFYIAITGFSSSCLRAGIMLFIFYFFNLFGKKSDGLTSLFLSTALICLFSPYSIFSLSLQLSFFAMLGCFISSSFIYKNKRLRKIPTKILRYVTFTVITTIIVTFSTLPVILLSFSSIPLLSVPANLIFVPIFNLLICLCPIFLLVSKIPLVSEGLAFLCESISRLAVDFVTTLAEGEGIVLNIVSWVQILGVIIISLSVASFAIFSKKLRYVFTILSLVGVLVLTIGSSIMLIEREKEVFIGTYNVENNDYIFIEKENELTVIDISSSEASLGYEVNALAGVLGYSEIENYILCDYSHTSGDFLKNLVGIIKVRNVYLLNPRDETELREYSKALSSIFSEKIDIHLLEPSIRISGVDINISRNAISRSERDAICVNIDFSSRRVCYLGSGTFELASYDVSDSAYLSDILIFGSYGPTMKIPYSYKLGYIDACVFLGGCEAMARADFLSSILEKSIIISGEFARFKLSE